MATYTSNLNLELQGSNEHASLPVLNANLGKIDQFAGEVATMMGYADVTIPVGTTAGSYNVGTLSSLDIPSGATIISAQCCNVTQSVCHVSGFAVNGSDVYVYVVETVSVANGSVRIFYIA